MTRAPRLSPLLLTAALLAGCGGDDEPQGQRSVAEIVAAEPGAIDELVTLEGRAYPIPATTTPWPSFSSTRARLPSPTRRSPERTDLSGNATVDEGSYRLNSSSMAFLTTS